MLVSLMYKIYALKLKYSDELKYIGRTITKLSNRLSKHKSNSKNSNKNHRVNWILKHINDIEIICIEENIKTFEESCEKEIFYINLYKDIYELTNSTLGGDGGCPGYKHTEEAKVKIGNVHRGKSISDEQKEILRNRIVSYETRKKLSDASKINNKGEKNPMYGRERPDTIKLNKERTGWKHNEDVINKMKEDRVGNKNSNYKSGKYTKENKLKKKRIYKLNINDVLEIRKLYLTGNYTYKKIGDMYNISAIYTSQVVRKIKWKNI